MPMQLKQCRGDSRLWHSPVTTMGKRTALRRKLQHTCVTLVPQRSCSSMHEASSDQQRTWQRAPATEESAGEPARQHARQSLQIDMKQVKIRFRALESTQRVPHESTAQLKVVRSATSLVVGWLPECERARRCRGAPASASMVRRSPSLDGCDSESAGVMPQAVVLLRRPSSAAFEAFECRSRAQDCCNCFASGAAQAATARLDCNTDHN